MERWGDESIEVLDGTQGLGVTQGYTSQEGFTQHAEATQTCGAFIRSGGGVKQQHQQQQQPNPDVDVWGSLRRKGGDAEEFKMRHRLKDGRRDTYLLGRSQTCDIQVLHKNVSSAHCRIYCDYSQARLRVFIEDASANGTFVNDSLTRLSKGERMELKSGDEVFLVNPRQTNSSSNGSSKESIAKERTATAVASFLFVNIRERVVANREKSVAPTMSQQEAQLTANVRHVEDVYVIGDEIGSGMSGTVHLCIERATGRHFAVKIIDTKKFALTPGLSPADLREEAQMMSHLDHPSIISIKDTFETGNIIFIVMELVRGGDLFDKIVEKGRYTETEARTVMQKVLSAVSYLHSKGIIHRDLKPENILLVDPNSDCEVKITDFGLAKRTNQEGLKTFCGTPQYFAPEVLKRKNTVAGVGTYGTSADVWSLGVVLYILLSGSFPFDEENLLDQIEHAQYSTSGPEWASISDAAKGLVRSMMTLRADQRLTVEQAMVHPFLTGEPWAPKESALDRLQHSTSGPEQAKAFKKASAKKRSTTGRNHTGLRRKQTSGSQGILQMMSVKSLKDIAEEPPLNVASMAVAMAYVSKGKPTSSANGSTISHGMIGCTGALASRETLSANVATSALGGRGGEVGGAESETVVAGKSLYSLITSQSHDSRQTRARVSHEVVSSKISNVATVADTKASAAKAVSTANERKGSTGTGSVRSKAAVLPKSANNFDRAVELPEDRIEEYDDDHEEQEEQQEQQHAHQQRKVSVEPRAAKSVSKATAAGTGTGTDTSKTVGSKRKAAVRARSGQTRQQQQQQEEEQQQQQQGQGPQGSLESAWKKVTPSNENKEIGNPENLANNEGEVTVSPRSRKLRVAPRTIADLFKPSAR